MKGQTLEDIDLSNVDLSSVDLKNLDPANLDLATIKNAITVISSTTPMTTTPVTTTMAATATETTTTTVSTATGGSGSGSLLTRGANGLVTLVLLLFAAVGMTAYTLRPRQVDGMPAVQSAPFMPNGIGNLLAILVGFVVGVAIFLVMRSLGLGVLPNGVGMAYAVVLLGLLAVKELFFSITNHPTAQRILSFGLTPLLVIFFLSVATQIGEVIR
ncbi:MAG: hypothetical protein R2932_06100 [Caldilineaceae bacterium]